MKNTEYDSLIFYGEGGLGKTFLTINEVKKLLKPSEWDYFNGYSTPLSIYEILYDNRNKKLIILDDIEGLFNELGVSSATEVLELIGEEPAEVPVAEKPAEEAKAEEEATPSIWRRMGSWIANRFRRTSAEYYQNEPFTKS